MSRPVLARVAAALVLAVAAGAALAGGGFAKGTPSNVTVTCGAGVQKATVTVQLMSSVSSPTPASNQLVLACSASARVATGKIAPSTQPAAAYSWSAFVTGSATTFGCGGTAARGSASICTNAAGGSEQVSVLAT